MPNYYDDPRNVEAYVKMAAGYDGRELIEALRLHLPDGAAVLELGMGPGVDFELLRQHYTVTGSDRSQAFLDRYSQKDPQADLIQLDVLSMITARRFDGIYSNKVLHHLTQEELRQSLAAQRRALNPHGVLLHSFWWGDAEEEMHGLHFTYYTEESLRAQVPDGFDIVEVARYGEMDDDDSLYIVLRRTD